MEAAGKLTPPAEAVASLLSFSEADASRSTPSPGGVLGDQSEETGFWSGQGLGLQHPAQKKRRSFTPTTKETPNALLL